MRTGYSTTVETNCDDGEVEEYIQPRSVKLAEIHQNGYENHPNRHLIVKVLWRSDKPPPESTTPCRFIFSDETDHIAAILFLSENIHTNIHTFNLYNRFKPGRILKLQNLCIEEEVPDNFRLIKHQSKQLKLSQSTRDSKPMINFSRSESFLSYLPINLTSLEDVDDLAHGTFVDVIGHAKYSDILTSKKNEMYQKVILSTHSSFSPEIEDDQFFRHLTLFGGQIGKIEPGKTYILQNVKVDTFDYNKSTINSIIATALTVAHEVINVENIKTFLQPRCVPPVDQLESLFSIESSSEEQYLPVCTSSTVIAGSSKRSLPSYLSQQPVRKQQKLELEGSEVKPDSEIEDEQIEDAYEDFPEDISYDFVNSKTPLAVEVIKAKRFKGTRSKAYTMRSKSRGIALVINNYFPTKVEKTRKGTHFDASYLEQFLRFCSFDVFIKNDVSSKELKTVLTEFKNKATNEVDCCFVAVLSHGLLQGIEMADGEIVNLHSEIIYEFDDFNFPIFKDKPKIFVIQACQNVPALESLLSLSRRNIRHQGRISLDNTIVCHATIPEVPADRDIYLGSPFIYVLVHTLMNHAHDRHFRDIYHEVRQRLKKVKQSQRDPLNCSYQDFGFKKLLYFNPGI